jgi:hypothetical protein
MHGAAELREEAREAIEAGDVPDEARSNDHR